MDYSARIRRIERTIHETPKDENIIILYDEQSAIEYKQQPNDFIIMYDYGELVE
ncbi:hypothetical protein [Planococcus faecalis]|uniref:hypothetical protein n=1 Tax=Planococcus faecalis TaxID=1598147 RepID=UPI00147579C6|nr:hypothetical protein [Planococcus faecalis]